MIISYDINMNYAVNRPSDIILILNNITSKKDLRSFLYFGFQVRVYTPKRLAQQLETAKEEFVRATVGIWKEQKILLPKLIESYAKDIKLTSQGLIQMVHRYLPENLRTAVYKCQQGRSNQIVEWAPYNFNFRYLLPRELTFPHTN